MYDGVYVYNYRTQHTHSTQSKTVGTLYTLSSIIAYRLLLPLISVVIYLKNSQMSTCLHSSIQMTLLTFTKMNDRVKNNFFGFFFLV